MSVPVQVTAEEAGYAEDIAENAVQVMQYGAVINPGGASAAEKLEGFDSADIEGIRKLVSAIGIGTAKVTATMIDSSGGGPSPMLATFSMPIEIKPSTTTIFQCFNIPKWTLTTDAPGLTYFDQPAVLRDLTKFTEIRVRWRLLSKSSEGAVYIAACLNGENIFAGPIENHDEVIENNWADSGWTAIPASVLNNDSVLISIRSYGTEPIQVALKAFIVEAR